MGLDVSNYEKSLVANSVFGGEAYVPAESFFLKLFSDTVDLDGIGTEITNAGYAAAEIVNDTTNFPHTTGTGAKSNAVALRVPADPDTLTEDSDEVVSAGLFDEDDNLRYRKVFPTPFIIPNGSYFSLGIGELNFVVSSI